MKRYFTILILILLHSLGFATHERAGEITFRHLYGLTYEFTITTYTFTPSPADRDSLEVKWGDGTTQNVARVEKLNYPNDISRNKYTTNHTFPASGYYTVSMEDPNRNYGVINIPNSVNIPFYIETSILINPFIKGNNSPTLLNPPIDNGCVGIPFYHNPGAFDADGDSLAYKIASCKGLSGEVIPGYSIPSYGTELNIDQNTGDFYWDSPIIQGEYNIAIVIEEYRQGFKIGSITRDMQISIGACNNHPPLIEQFNDTCIVAGTTLEFTVKATDTDNDQILLTASGSALSTSPNPALFNQNMVGVGSVLSNFSWNTNCDNVRKYPFQVSFKAKDDGSPISLVSIKTTRITVVAPSPKLISVEAFGNNMHLIWQKAPCPNAIGYKIFRHDGSSGWLHNHCETGAPAYTGFYLVGTTNSISDTTFTDTNNGSGLLYGNDYCYLVVATFSDFAESYASNELCASLKRDVPIITHVSVSETNTSSGKMDLKWSKPTEFDPLQFPGPYEYKVYRAANNTNTFSHIYSTTNLNDTILADNNFNTIANGWKYKIEFYNNTPGNTVMIGTSNSANSIYLEATPSDNRVTLSWSANVPWINKYFDIFRYNPFSSSWDSIGTTPTYIFTDTSLANNIEQCYYVRSFGNYTITGISSPLINLSQQVCATPVDNVPPCAATLSGTTDCIRNYFTWNLNNNECLEDVVQYKLYRSSTQNDELSLIETINDPLTYSASYLATNSIAGCFLIETIDSNQNVARSNYICYDIDSCSLYKLPNVFSPNNDGVNDTFHPFPYDFVDHVNMNIYNRWGNLVYTTTNPDILWDGKNRYSNQECPDGVYFYVCDVFEFRLEGIKMRSLHGSVSLYR